jgi:hypothetical protein
LCNVVGQIPGARPSGKTPVIDYPDAQAAFPWAPEAYPGLLRGMVELLGGRAAVRTILDWRRGRRAPPYWALDQLQEALKKRVVLETRSIEELEREKAARLTAP